MKISWIKYEKDNKSFKIPELLGYDVVKLINPEETDKTIEQLIKNEYKTVILSNEIAGFSQNIIKKYKNDENINIIIARGKEYNS